MTQIPPIHGHQGAELKMFERFQKFVELYSLLRPAGR